MTRFEKGGGVAFFPSSMQFVGACTCSNHDMLSQRGAMKATSGACTYSLICTSETLHWRVTNCASDRLYIPLPMLVEEGRACLANETNARVLLISGSPAMGKSLLANNLARTCMLGGTPTSTTGRESFAGVRF